MQADTKMIRIPLVIHAQLLSMLEEIQSETGLRITLTSYVTLAIKEKMARSLNTEPCSE